jgi:hypothetical protein
VSAASTSYIGVYISDGGDPVALCGCNLDFAAAAGAATGRADFEVALGRYGSGVLSVMAM